MAGIMFNFISLISTFGHSETNNSDVDNGNKLLIFPGFNIVIQQRRKMLVPSRKCEQECNYAILDKPKLTMERKHLCSGTQSLLPGSWIKIKQS